MARFEEPALKNKEAEKIIEGHSDKATQQISNAAETGKEKIRKERDEVINTPGQKLNPQEKQNDNFAKTGGSKGSLTGKDFSSTLNLMRRADKYNNKPVENMIHYGSYKGSGVQNLGTGYERPKIETEEMREMERNRALDAQQKQLMVQLQDAINRKDIEAFKSAYEQIFGITLSETQIIEAIRQWTQQQQITNTATKDITSWQKKFMRSFDEETLDYLMQLSETDNQLSQLLSNAMYGLPTPSLDERVLIRTRDALYKRNKTEKKMSDIKAMNDANNTVLALNLLNDNIIASTTKRSQRPGNKVSGYFDAKDVVNEAKGL